MHKIKLHPGLASIILVASLFAGWQALLLVTLLMFVLCEVDESVKNVAVKVVTFLVGVTIVSVGWGLIYDGIHVGVDALEFVLSLVNEYVLDPVDAIILTDYTEVLFSFLSVADGVVDLLINLAELAFIIAILTGKAGKENFITKKINVYVNSALNYVSGNAAPAAPVQPAPPTPPAAPQQM